MHGWKSRVALILCCASLFYALPALAATAFSGGSGTPGDPYLLSTAADLRRMREQLAMDASFANGAPCFRLTADIRLNQGLGEAFNWRPIARFGGDLDGAGFTITGMYVPVDNAVQLEGSDALGGGFIGELMAGGRVHDLTLSGCVEVPVGAVRTLVGGLVCDNRGEVADCISYVTITVTRAIGHLQSSGIAAASTGRLLRCIDRSRFFIYPEVLDDAGVLSYSGLVGDPAGAEAGEVIDCVDESQYVGAEYPAVWNLYVPSPKPSLMPTSFPTPSLTPAPETLVPLNTAVSPTPSLALAVTETPAVTAARDPAQAALADMQNAVSAVGSLFAQDVRIADDYRYAVSADGQSVAILAYTGAGGCVAVPDTLAGLPVTRIGAGAFAGQQALLELDLPDGVTTIADDALADCHRLYRLHLPAALETLPLNALRGCGRLVYIDMPARVSAITGNFPLESAAVTVWDNGSAKAAAYAAAHGLTVRAGAYRGRATDAVDGIAIRFRPGDTDAVRVLYESELGRDAGAETNIDFSLTGFAWRDAVFAQASGIYDHALARLSMGFSAAAFRSTDGTGGGFQDQNILRALLDCGFSNIHADGYEACDEAGIASAIASKQITVEGQPITLVALAASGAGYGPERLSNLNVCHADPNSPEHNGFAAATDTLFARLKTYLDENLIAGTRWKLWLTGFDRGAAVCDLLAARCQGTLLPAEDCYAYLFATPGVCKAAAPVQTAGDVWNIVNPCDPLASLPPEGWGYVRYGRTLLLPGWRAKDVQGYLAQFDAMLAMAQSIRTAVLPDEALFPFLRLRGEGDRHLSGTSRFLRELTEFVMPSAALYDTQFYQSLRALWQSGLGEAQSMTRALRVVLNGPLLQLAQRSPNLSLVGVLDGCYRSQALANTRKAAEALLASTADKSLYPAIGSVLRGEASEDAILNYPEVEHFVVPALTDAASLLVSMHSPELYLAWMMSLSGDDLTSAMP